MAGVANESNFQKQIRNVWPQLKGSLTEQINTWLLDYAFFMAFEEFKEYGTVDEDSNRFFVQGILSRSAPSSCRQTRIWRVQMLMLLCHVADGENEPTDKVNEEPPVTILEHAVHILKTLSKNFPNIPGSDNLSDELKTQAVLSCVRLGEFVTALEVFERLYGSAQLTDTEQQLQKVAQQKTEPHPILDEHPYSSLKNIVCRFVQHVQDQFDTPFLVQAAHTKWENISRNHNHDNNKNNMNNNPSNISKDQEVLLTGPMLSGVLEELDLMGHPLSLSSKKNAALQRKIKRARQKAHRTDITDLDDFDEELLQSVAGPSSKQTTAKRKEEPSASGSDQSIDDDSGDESSEPVPKLSKKTPAKFRRNVGRPDRHQPVIKSRKVRQDSLSSDDHENSPVYARSTSKKPEIVPMLRRPWSSKEEVKLYQQVQKHGVGHWSQMRQTGLFDGRTNVNLKDKWRQMLNSGRAKELSKVFGPV